MIGKSYDHQLYIKREGRERERERERESLREGDRERLVESYFIQKKRIR